MHSTWMDPLIGAQHTRRCTTPSDSAHYEKVDAEPQHTSNPDLESNYRRTELLDREIADWDQDAFDTLPEMEIAVGISDWIDPQTGSPAEGHSPLHIEFE